MLFWNDPNQQVTIGKFEKHVGDLQKRGAEASLSVMFDCRRFKVPSTEELTAKIKNLANEQVATRLSGVLMEEAVHSYVENKDIARAKRLADTAFAILASRLTPEANNMGYLYMACGDLAEAKLWFDSARQHDRLEDMQLVEYNLGVLAALTKDYAAARQHLKNAKGAAEMDAACLYRLVVRENGLSYEEVFEPRSISSMANEGLSVLDAIS